MAGYDNALQARLDTLWFRMPADAPQTRRADYQRFLLREFQICCRSTHGARLKSSGTAIDGDNLVQIALPVACQLPATHWPDGIADAATLAAVTAWEAAELRCPLIFQQLRKTLKKPPTTEIVAQGLFFSGEVQHRGDVVWVRDFTGRYPIIPAGQPDAGLPARIAVGSAERRMITTTVSGKKVKVIRWGNKADAGQRIVRLTPDNLTGKTWDQLAALGAQPTFRVIAAVAFIEASETLDAINAWDTSALSIGPYQYTAFGPDETDKAELAAFLAYLQSAAPQVHNQHFRDVGIAPREAWSAKLRAGNATFAAQLQIVADAQGGFAPPASVEERDWLRCWPVIHRTRHSIAQSAELRLAMWTFARQRLSDLLSAKWTGTDPTLGAKTMGDVFRTELTAALLLRLHVKRPRYPFKAGFMDALISDAGIKKAVSTWTAAEDAKLAKAFAQSVAKAKLREFLSTSIRTDLKAISLWNSPKCGALSTVAGFTPYTAGIPFPPAKDA